MEGLSRVVRSGSHQSQKRRRPSCRKRALPRRSPSGVLFSDGETLTVSRKVSSTDSSLPRSSKPATLDPRAKFGEIVFIRQSRAAGITEFVPQQRAPPRLPPPAVPVAGSVLGRRRVLSLEAGRVACYAEAAPRWSRPVRASILGLGLLRRAKHESLGLLALVDPVQVSRLSVLRPVAESVCTRIVRRDSSRERGSRPRRALGGDLRALGIKVRAALGGIRWAE